MSAIHPFIDRAKSDEPVYICHVRDAFQRESTRRFHYDARLYDDSVRRFELKLPACDDAEELAFLEEYLNAMLYNTLSALGAKSVTVYVDPGDAALAAYAARLDDVFQVNAPLAERRGYGRCLNVNERIIGGGFRFEVRDIGAEPALEAPASNCGAADFSALPGRVARGRYMGMDVGGTDVKLAASLDGRLCAFKEYDWNPSACTRAEDILDPLLLLARLMRASVCAAERGMVMPERAFDRAAADSEIERIVADMEARLGDDLRPFDGIGVCFPDVVIDNRIVGGETPKTQGLRAAPDYEAEFGKISGLCESLRAFVKPGGAVGIVNDGSMSAFTAAVEEAQDATPGRENAGSFAHSLGTDLGTGWVLPDGTIPDIPLEIYNFIIDLGSHGQRACDPQDVRSVRSFNTGLPGAVQKYTGQFGIFRLAAKYLPGADPALYRRAFEEKLLRWEGDQLAVLDRKACLEFFMEAAGDVQSPAAELFRRLGECLAVTWRETQFILNPACAERTLFGRLVKRQACFDEICQGARRVAPDITLRAADGALARSPLMKQLAGNRDYTVAQFGQAVGAIYYAASREKGQ